MARLQILIEVDADPDFDDPAFVADTLLLRAEDSEAFDAYPTFFGSHIHVVGATWTDPERPVA